METKSKGKKRVTTFDELIESRHGKIGTKKRTDFEIKAKSFAIGEIIKEERRLANMTQDELAEKTGQQCACAIAGVRCCVVVSVS
jgi:hypothetical protein